jgi:hypothetical protein
VAKNSTGGDTKMEQKSEKTTKKSQILRFYESGLDVELIADALDTNPSYVANTIAEAGHSVPYFDLYTTTSAASTSRYGREFAGVLKFKDVNVARESVRQIDELYHRFQREKDRRGQHQAQMMALIGKNRAAGIGKLEEADVFATWLKTHLNDIADEEGIIDPDPRSHA